MSAHGKTLLDAGFEKLVEDCLKAYHIPGLALAVVDGENSWEQGFGIADVDTGEEVRPNTLFMAGSTAKSFTAAAASLLVDASTPTNPVTWSTPMYTLIPSTFVLASPLATTTTTLADCLSHRSGLATHRVDLGAATVAQTTRNLRHLELTAPPRTKYQYSSHMYWAVSHMIEAQTGHSLEEFMRERIWTPLAMEGTFLSVESAKRYAETLGGEVGFAKGHMWDEEAAAFQTLPYIDDVGLSGAGGLVSNVSDLARWVHAFIEQSPPLSKEGYAALTAPQMIMPPESERFTGPLCYGFGWWVGVYRGERVILHPGGLIGFCSSLIYLPEKKWGVVGMCNGTSEEVLDTPMWTLVDRFLGVSVDETRDIGAEAKAQAEGMKSFFASTKSRLFPPTSIPTPPLPPSLPLSAYAGSYTHLSYGSIHLRSIDGELRGSFPGRIALDPLVLEHISGDFFLAKAELVKLISVRAKARFEVGVEGKVERLGVQFEERDQELVTWFVRKP